jgi:protocatechuate 3,4-dioxygenase beta subunit
MKFDWRWRITTYFGLGLLLVCGHGTVRAQGPAPFRIAGTVVSAASGMPLAQTRVWINDVRHPEAVQAIMTSENGRFEFNQLGPGKYSLQGMRHGFIAASYDAHEEYATAIVTGAGIDTENLILRLTPAAVLAGTVLDESGEPVRQSTVTLYREDHSLGVSQVVQINGTATDDLGFYEFARLAPGNYFVSATAKPWYAVHPPFSESPGESDSSAVERSLDVAYPTTYYPDATDADQASPIPLKGGDHFQVEIRLHPVPALHLRFHVADQGRNGLVAPSLGRRAFDSFEYIPNDSMQSVSPGVYELSGIPAGRYDLRVGSGSGQVVQSDVDLINDGQDLDSAAGQPVSSVKASVQMLGQKELPDQLQIVLSDSRHRIVANQILGNGEVRFEGIEPGKYSVLASAPATGQAYAVVRLWSQNAEIAGNTLNVPVGSNLEISVSLATGSAHVEGFAKRGGKGTAGAMIVLVPQDPENHRELFRRDQSDLDGSFNLPNVVPGTYTVIAIENGWELDWSQPAVLMQYANHGPTVRVGAQAHGSVRVPEPVEIQSRQM